MARKPPPVRFKTDRGLEIAVENAAAGLTITGRQTRTRKRRTTLGEISEDMAFEARKFARAYPQRERRSAGGLQKTAPRHPFDRSNPATETYIKSIRALEPRRVRGRLSIEIVAAHPKAEDVEYGNAGGVVRRVHSKGKRFAIPIHKWKYDQLQKQRNLSLKKRRAAGWPSAQKDMRRIYSRRSNLRISIDRFEDVKLKKQTLEQSRARVAWQKRNVARAKEIAAEAGAAKGRLSKKRRVWALGPDSPIPSDRPYMLVESFETYSEYAILRRAMKLIAIRRFE